MKRLEVEIVRVSNKIVFYLTSGGSRPLPHHPRSAMSRPQQSTKNFVSLSSGLMVYKSLVDCVNVTAKGRGAIVSEGEEDCGRVVKANAPTGSTLLPFMLFLHPPNILVDKKPRMVLVFAQAQSFPGSVATPVCKRVCVY